MYLSENMSYFTKLPNFPFTPIILKTIPLLSGINPEHVRPFEAIEKIYPRPIFFIHSDADKTIFCRHSEILSSQCPGQFQFWKTSGVLHLRSHQIYPSEYQEKVITFLDSVVDQKKAV